MHLVPPGSNSPWGGDDPLARMNAMLDELRGGPPFDVAGLVSPDLEPRWLTNTSEGSDGWSLISLLYGESLASTGPTVIVRTAIEGRDGHVEPDLSELVDSERHRLFTHAGIDEPDPTEDPTSDHRTVEIDGDRVEAAMLLDGDLWAARMVFPPEVGVEDEHRTISVVGRGVAPDDVRLASVDDLGPYVDGRDHFIRSMIAGRPEELQRSGRDAVPEGEAALRGIIEYCVREALQHEEARRGGRRRSPRQSPGHRYGLWQAAVRFQSSAWDQGEDQANEQVTSVVNHLSRLACEAEWFGARKDLREAAIDEATAHVARGEAVASAAAHRVWNALWAEQHPAALDLDRSAASSAESARSSSAWAEGRETLRASWLQEWSRWAGR